MLLANAIALGLGAVAQASDLKSNPAHFVAERAGEVSWSQDGSCVGFGYLDREGRRIDAGVYDLTRHEGKTLLKATGKQQIDQLIWLAHDPLQLAVISEQLTLNGKQMVRQGIYEMDGRKLSVKQLWSGDFPLGQQPNIVVNASPTLAHAIVTFHLKEGKNAYFIVTNGGKDLIPSPDVADAIKQGNGFAGWTNEGTAFFGGGRTDDLSSGPDHDFVLLYELRLDKAQADQQDRQLSIVRSDEDQARAAATLSSVTALIDTISSLKLHTKSDEPLAPGAYGFELTPSDGQLRPVKFPGPYLGAPAPKPTTQLRSLSGNLRFEESSAGIKSLWLTPKQDKPTRATLVAPQAEQAWLHPDGHTVLFLVNGVLFERSVSAPSAPASR
jgi:hypothetical protein